MNHAHRLDALRAAITAPLLVSRLPNLQYLTGFTGSNGFQINGETAYDRSGYRVSGAGDLNGDGIDDLVICAQYATSAGPPT